jgi:hypothetical protein
VLLQLFVEEKKVLMPQRRSQTPQKRLYAFYKFRFLVGFRAQSRSPSKVAKETLSTVRFVQYWKQKVADDTFHSKPHGGRRYVCGKIVVILFY